MSNSKVYEKLYEKQLSDTQRIVAHVISFGQKVGGIVYVSFSVFSEVESIKTKGKRLKVHTTIKTR